MIPRIAAAVGLACITVLAIPAVSFAGTGTVSGGGTTATISIQDAVFADPGCIGVPFDVTFTDIAVVSLEMSLPGSNTTLVAQAGPIASGAGRVDDLFLVCPEKGQGAGTYAVRGSMRAFDMNMTETQIPAGLQFTVSRAPTSITGLTALQKGSVLRISGEVMTQTKLGGDGTVRVTMMLPKSLGGNGKWVTAGTTSPDELGRFAVTKSLSSSKGIAGAQIRVTVTDSAWSGDASASTRVKRAS
jgi:hypothetical protein